MSPGSSNRLQRYQVLAWGVSLIAVMSCRSCVDQVTPVELRALRVMPSTAELPPTIPGTSTSVTLSLHNPNREERLVTVGIEPPFSVKQAPILVPGFEAVDVTVHFLPTSTGTARSVALFDDQAVELKGEAIEAPNCPVESCVSATFDVSSRRCVLTNVVDGTACTSLCSTAGQCRSGKCAVATTECDDNNACTIDACGPTGCTHLIRECPKPSNPCLVSSCQAETGCQEQPVRDGSLCAEDDCQLPQVNVCIAGTCVARPRPSGNRCTNTWLQLNLGGRFGHAIVYDEARDKVVLFGGVDERSPLATNSDTWEWNGNRWMQRFPSTAPSPRWGHAMVYDSVRRRVVLYGGTTDSYAKLNDLWEWDGQNWSELQFTEGPRLQSEPLLAYDSARRRLVLFGSASSSPEHVWLFHTWEWDGLRWTSVPSSGIPRAVSLIYDTLRNRAVLIVVPAAANGASVWTWNGQAWEPQANSDSPDAPIAFHGAAYDSHRNRIVTFGGGGARSRFHPHQVEDRTSEFDGATWHRLLPSSSPPARTEGKLAYDSRRRRMLLMGGSSQQGPLGSMWAWNGTAWTEEAPDPPPSGLTAFDSVRNRMVFVATQTGPSGPQLEPWEWDGTRWHRRNAMSSPSSLIGVVFDEARAESIVLTTSATWAWNGSAWNLRASVSPGIGALAYDRRRRSLVLNTSSHQPGGYSISTGTWEWDGATWQQREPTPQPQALRLGAMYTDEASGKVRAQRDPVGSLPGPWLEWQGTHWVQLPALPGGGYSHSVAGGPTPMCIVSNFTSSQLSQTLWRLESGQWTQLVPQVAPLFSSDHQILYNPALRRTQLIEAGSSGRLWVYLPQ